MTQASIVTTQDGNFAQSDDTDESPSRRRVLPTTQKRHRMRSSSVSLSGTGRNERGEKMGVLKTVQLHTRSRHVFAPVETLASAKERLLAEAVDLGDVVSRPLLVRRNSTSAPLSPLLDASNPVHLPTPPPDELDQASEEPAQVTFAPPVNEFTSTSATTQSVTPPPSPNQSPKNDYVATFLTCQNEDSAPIVRTTIRRMLLDPTPPKLEHFNAALRALNRTRRSGEPLSSIIRLYNAILDASVVPNIETYETLIMALTSRDFEVHHAIASLEYRLKNERLLGSSINLTATEDRLEKLKAEDNFGSAMSLFESVVAVNGIRSLYRGAFAALIRSCSFHCNVNAAIHVFAQLEWRKNVGIDHPVYRYMINTFSNAHMIRQAEETFNEFLKARRSEESFSAMDYQSNNRREQIKVWNAMIETYFQAGMPDKAIELLERMLASTAGDRFGPKDIPIVTPSSFTAVISGFIKSGDISSALSWFERLLAQKEVVEFPYQGLGGAPMRPDKYGWHIIFEGLAKYGKIDDLNRLYHVMRSSAVQDRLEWRAVDQLIVYSANLANLKHLDNEAALKVLNFIMEDATSPSSRLFLPENLHLITSLAVEFAQRGQFLTAAELTKTWFGTAYDPNSTLSHVVEGMQNDVNRITQLISTSAKNGKGDLDFRTASVIVQLHSMLGLEITLEFAPWYLHAYGFGRLIDVIDCSQLSSYERDLLLDCAVRVELAALEGTEGLTVVPQYAFKGIASLLEDFAHELTFNDINKELGERTIELLQAQLGDAGCRELFSRLDPSYIEAFNQFQKIRYSALESALAQDSEEMATLQSPIQEYPSYKLNQIISEGIDIILRTRGSSSTQERMERAYNLLKQGLNKQESPEPHVIAYLIQACGRCNEIGRVRELYTLGQAVLKYLSPERQLDSWVFLESSMIVALGHSGNIDAAHVHRLRILDQGCAPSADAYGVLIQYVKDTTDDTSGAVALFLEALERGVKPNLYLYNNIISKLGKARKADYALEIFQQMKANNCVPSSITYSAVIGACARVGDVQLAESLFSEMTRFFKPRVPAYNTMMQLFTTTKPNRTSSLYYYKQLLKAGVEPSAYTYKVHRSAFSFFVMFTDHIQLLMDTYGCLEPVDLPAMEKVFQELQENPNVQLTTGHFTSLINAYGCVAKDFDKAIAVFQSIPTYPNAPPLDAIVFEAVINVLVTHRRTDLLPVYVSKMNEAGVHMTAYIANFLIRGYANVGDLDQARSIFESLRDPPSGMAAPNNHAPHHPEVSPDVHIMDVVYREVRINYSLFFFFLKLF